MKKILTIMVFLMTAGAAMAQTQISNEEGLRAIADDMNGDYILTADITLTGSWSPLGTPNSDDDNGSFTGTLDGNGHTISGLGFKIDDKDVVYMGLFGRIGSAGVVKNLNVNKISDEGLLARAGDNNGTRNIGTIAGVNHGTILNCRSDVNIACYASYIDGGGIAGENAGLIKNCVYTGTIIGGNYTNVIIGGIVGDNESGGTLQNCVVTATITGGLTASPLYGQDHGNVNDCAYQFKNNQNQDCVRLEGRTLFKDGEWNTLCLPFDVVIGSSYLNGATIMELDTDEPDEDNEYEHVTGIEGTTLYLNFKIVTDQIVAGKPYIVKWSYNQNNLVDPDFTNASLNGLISGSLKPDSVTSNDGNVTFKGEFFSKDIVSADNTVFFLGEGSTLYYPNATMSINAFRGYFQLKNGYYGGEPQEEPSGDNPDPGVNIQGFSLNFGNETTDIVNIDHSPLTTDHSCYTLDGRRVDGKNLKPGIYIMDGKKILIRK